MHTGDHGHTDDHGHSDNNGHTGDNDHSDDHGKAPEGEFHEGQLHKSDFHNVENHALVVTKPRPRSTWAMKSVCRGWRVPTIWRRNSAPAATTR